MKPEGGLSVMADRKSDPLALDYFPTPPWATRALLHDALPDEPWSERSVWEPAAGEGHMTNVLKESVRIVCSSDVHDYKRGYRIGSFVGLGEDVAKKPFGKEGPDWIITNPPFNLALEFAQRGLQDARCGVALLVRSVWAEGRERYESLFSKAPPSVIAQFAERVPMVAGRWDPQASTATSYAWFIWLKNERSFRPTEFRWIPPGARARHTRSDDIARFCKPEAA